MQFYEHSGRCGTWGVPLASAAGIFAGLVLGLVYAYVVNWIPIIYVSFLATAAFGFAVGAAVVWGAKSGLMRNMTVALMTAGVVGVLAVYFAWVFDPMARLPDILDWPIWGLEALAGYMALGYEHGFWSIGRNGNAVTGPLLAAVWIIEAAMIVGIVCFTVNGLLGNQPFCEETNQWTKTEKTVARLSLVDDVAVETKVARLLEGDVATLDQFYRADDVDAAVLELDLAGCPDCPTCNYLTVRMIQHVANKKGEVTKQENKLLVNLLVAPEDVPGVRQAGADRPIDGSSSADQRDAGEDDEAEATDERPLIA